MSAIIRFEQTGGIARLTLNRPDQGNSIDLDMARMMLQLSIRCDTDSSIRCVVLTGSGRMFCVGGDIGGFSNAGEKADVYLSELAGIMNLAMSRFARMGKPLLVLVNGPAAGAGLSIALAGDVVLADRSAHFTSAYTAIGLVPDSGLTWWLPRAVGMRRAQEIIATNRRIDADEAAAIGLITRVADDLDAEGQVVAQSLASSATRAIGAARLLIHESFATSYETQMEREARAIAAAGVGAEGRAGVAAFLAKRRPTFQDD